MIFIRSVIYFLFMVISVIIHGGLIALLGWLLPQSYSDWLATAWGRVNLVAMRWLCNLDVNIEGWENIPQESAGIIMSKHQSTWETISLRGLIPDSSILDFEERVNANPNFWLGITFHPFHSYRS